MHDCQSVFSEAQQSLRFYPLPNIRRKVSFHVALAENDTASHAAPLAAHLDVIEDKLSVCHEGVEVLCEGGVVMLENEAEHLWSEVCYACWIALNLGYDELFSSFETQ